MPFEILKQDKDEVIMWINFTIEDAQQTQQTSSNKTIEKNDGQIKRVCVNDKTASGGWF